MKTLDQIYDEVGTEYEDDPTRFEPHGEAAKRYAAAAVEAQIALCANRVENFVYPGTFEAVKKAIESSPRVELL